MFYPYWEPKGLWDLRTIIVNLQYPSGSDCFIVNTFLTLHGAWMISMSRDLNVCPFHPDMKEYRSIWRFSQQFFGTSYGYLTWKGFFSITLHDCVKYTCLFVLEVSVKENSRVHCWVRGTNNCTTRNCWIRPKSPSRGKEIRVLWPCISNM